MGTKRRGRRRKTPLGKRLERALELPTGTLCASLRIEFSANRRAVIEGCRRVLRYDEDCIRLETVEGEISFEGERLCVNCLSGGSAVVTGRFVTVGFHDEGGDS